jgi:hypothetical protein
VTIRLAFRAVLQNAARLRQQASDLEASGAGTAVVAIRQEADGLSNRKPCVLTFVLPGVVPAGEAQRSPPLLQPSRVGRLHAVIDTFGQLLVLKRHCS